MSESNLNLRAWRAAIEGVINDVRSWGCFSAQVEALSTVRNEIDAVLSGAKVLRLEPATETLTEAPPPVDAPWREDDGGPAPAPEPAHAVHDLADGASGGD
jgi:hypothetical protein